MVTPNRIDLAGLTTRPAQVWGAVRLVPLVRDTPIAGLRLDRRVYAAGDPAIVDVGNGTTYASFIPHAFVAAWSDGQDPTAAFGTHVHERPTDPRRARVGVSARAIRRMARLVEPNRLRFLPMHLAMEGYLALHFGGPTYVWEEWTDTAIRNGLSPRVEDEFHGEWVKGLADALRVFEIHPGQCGVALYVADALASLFVVPHPADYRALHSTLLNDMYGATLLHYATHVDRVPEFTASIDADRVSSFTELRSEALRQSLEWARFHDDVMAAGLLGDVTYQRETVYRFGAFTLSRFLPGFRLNEENHIGETITDDTGRIAYCKTFRLTAGQVKRGYLLSRVHEHDWDLVATAEALGTTTAVLARRIERAGLGRLLRRDVVERLERTGRRPMRGRK
ncbi:ARPP-2 domain-containing protein [Embleya sp. NPDC001921]